MVIVSNISNFVNNIRNKPDDYHLRISWYLTIRYCDKIYSFHLTAFRTSIKEILSYYIITMNIQNLVCVT